MVGRVKGKVGRDIGPNPIPLGDLHRMVWRGFGFFFLHSVPDLTYKEIIVISSHTLFFGKL